MKRGFIENLDNFLKITKKILKKKKRLANFFKQKLSKSKQNLKTVVINILGNLSKKELPNSILVLTLRKNIKNIAIIGANVYYLAC